MDHLRLCGLRDKMSSPVTVSTKANIPKALFEMSKEVVDQNESMETRGRVRKISRSRDMLSALDGRVAKLDGSIGDMKETLKEVAGCTTKLETRHD
ncbi:hypothetical protein PVK06_019483 [Gossypium arboreum]|uniref:Uncharacterized protein n=1 Tax=Gossypium arboreum TaxID=29729 RepID=A0ABR0PJW2_GOSAR|nr:hypothetical protein PVK06_019483 [Gossypium arboreum]